MTNDQLPIFLLVSALCVALFFAHLSFGNCNKSLGVAVSHQGVSDFWENSFHTPRQRKRAKNILAGETAENLRSFLKLSITRFATIALKSHRYDQEQFRNSGAHARYCSTQRGPSFAEKTRTCMLLMKSKPQGLLSHALMCLSGTATKLSAWFSCNPRAKT